MLLVYPTLPLKGAKAMQAIETSTGTLRTALLWEKKKKNETQALWENLYIFSSGKDRIVGN